MYVENLVTMLADLEVTLEKSAKAIMSLTMLVFVN
jgi:hypothetical protein